MAGKRIITEETMVEAGINFLCRSVRKTTIVIAGENRPAIEKCEDGSGPEVSEVNISREKLICVDCQSRKECIFIVADRRRNAICELDTLERHGIKSVLKRHCMLNSLKKYAMY